MSEFDDVPPDDPYAPTSRGDSLKLTEQAVIGCVLRWPVSARDLRRQVAGGDFHDPHMGAIFDGILGMVDAGEPIDYLTVADHLAEWQVSTVDVMDLSRWADGTTTAEAGAVHARAVRSASMRRLMHSAGLRLQQGGDDAALTLQAVVDELARIGTLGGGRKPLTSLRDLLDVPEIEDAYDWVIPDVLERRDRLMLVGGEGAGKSTWLRQLAVLSAAGVHPFRFGPIPPIRVLVVDAENSARQWRRAARHMADQAAIRGVRDPRDAMSVQTVDQFDITNANDLTQVHEWLTEARADLLLIGPMYRVVSGSLNDEEYVSQRVLRALDSLRDRNVAMLIELHAGHARSQSGEREMRPRGSSALLGWPEFGLGLRKDKAIEGRSATTSLVRWRGDRDPREFPKRFTRGQVFPWEPTVSIY